MVLIKVDISECSSTTCPMPYNCQIKCVECVFKFRKKHFLPFVFINFVFKYIFVFFQRNVKEIMDAGGIKVLVDLLTLAHLHTTRATVPLQV